MKELILFSKVIGAIVATCVGLWFFGEPFLEDYVEGRIEAHTHEEIEKNSKKVKLRKLLSDKMGVPEDEVHIEIGRLYKKEANVIREIKRHHSPTLLIE